MDWSLFWSAIGAIGGTLGAIATTVAVIVALWQTKYNQKKKLKLDFFDNIKVYNPNTEEIFEFVEVSITNIGNRKVIVRQWGVHLKRGSIAIIVPPNESGMEKFVCESLPKTLDLEESVDLRWRKDRFQSFLECEYKDNINWNKPLVFYVKDSTGKQYIVKTKKNASYYLNKN